MLLSSGVLDAMIAPVEQVLQRAAAVNIKMDALELCGLHHPRLFYDPAPQVPPISPRSCALQTGMVELHVCH